jgi:O-succinylhomoserine sulfhydrylase
MKFETHSIRGGQIKTEFSEHSIPIFPTSSFTFNSAEEMQEAFSGDSDALIYSRYNNPNTDALIDKINLLEKTEDGVTTASGMAAVFASMASFLTSGDHIIASNALFGSTFQIITSILPKWGIHYTFVSANAEEKDWIKALRPTTKMVVIESPSNPGLSIIDLEMIGRICKNNGLIFNIDNCFASPYIQNPIEYGADIIVHSSTKWMDGQGRILGGLILGKKEYIEKVRFFTRHTGPAMSPFNAWILYKSLETLSVRMDRHCENAHQLAEFLESNHINVRYPFLPSHKDYSIAKKQMKLGGGIIAFEIDKPFQFINALKLCSISANLGDTRTIITHPASSTHSKLTPQQREESGISNELIRVSTGLENIEDIINDFKNALII